MKQRGTSRAVALVIAALVMLSMSIARGRDAIARSKGVAKRSANATLASEDSAVITVETLWAGPVPEPQVVDLDPDCALRLGRATHFSETFRIKGGHLGDVLIYVDAKHRPKLPRRETPALLSMRTCHFDEKVLAIQAGEELEVMNAGVGPEPLWI